MQQKPSSRPQCLQPTRAALGHSWVIPRHSDCAMALAILVTDIYATIPLSLSGILVTQVLRGRLLFLCLTDLLR